MSFSVRDAQIDVAILAGPRTTNWPSAGARAISAICARMGLEVAALGGENIRVRGVVPLPGTGGIVVTEDTQNRIHRYHARAIVRLSSEAVFPDPFPGWRSQGLIPYSTAQRLRRESQVSWNPATVVLGTGNKALRFASSLLESEVSEVYCVESRPDWGAKRFAGWEVEKRRFEVLGGKLIEAKPLQLAAKAPLLWEFKLKDTRGVRVLDVARVVSVGPFEGGFGVREYPPGSFLFELEQTALETKAEDVEGWVLEEERGKWLASRIVRTLASNSDELDQIMRRSRGRLRRYFLHREQPFTPSYQGKWISSIDSKKIRSYRAVPQTAYKLRAVASLECFEDIPCNICQTVCPENAIEIGRVPRDRDSLLTESRCTACGICVTACPSSAISMIEEKDNHSTAQLTLPWHGRKKWKVGEFASLLNRRGELLGSARITVIDNPNPSSQQVSLEIPAHLIWEARGIKRMRTTSVAAAEEISYVDEIEKKAEILLNGEKRLVRNGVSASVALFETGQSRPEDTLFCPDGSCGLCQINVDGTKKLACQTEVHRGMSVRLNSTESTAEALLCPCLGITLGQVKERMEHGKLSSPEAVLSALHVGEGKCHGQFCMGAFKRAMLDLGLDSSQWIDWRFPWSEWTLKS